MKEMILAPFRKWNSFNNLRKDVKFGTGWVDSLLKKLQALFIIFRNGLMHKSLSNTWDSVDMELLQYEIN